MGRSASFALLLLYNSLMQIYSDKCFDNPIDNIEIFEPSKLKEGFEKLENLRAKGLYLLGYLRYDLTKTSDKPLMYFEAFETFDKYIPAEISRPVGTIIIPKIAKEEYFKSVEYIKEQIRDGVTYEVNYTYPSAVKTNADDFELYEFLLPKQKTPYNTYIKNKYETILSFSPELFFKQKGNKILTKPMKGTAPREEGMKEFLYNDIKNRAENIMIVDLLRNDLGRIAKTGSVKVEKLFEIEEHPTVYQMTSEVSAEVDCSLYDIFRAIYPCGSITGAPKVSTMRVIEEVESFTREVYCGAIGYLHDDEAVFSVPIRILQKGVNDKEFTYHAGGAIVWDSTAEDEWQETLTKTKFLQTEFSLIETGINDWDKHADRMKKSAEELGFKWNDEIENLEIPVGKVLRVVLNMNGEYQVEYHPTPALSCPARIKRISLTLTFFARRSFPVQGGSVRVTFNGRVDTSNPFLYHKTTVRDKKQTEFFDEIRVNERGEITEGTFTNVGILKDGMYYTPPVSCGLLAGTFREKLDWEEKVLYPDDLKSADKVFCFNSVRGLMEVELC